MQDGNTTVGTAALTGGNVAFSVPALVSGIHVFSAHYSGDQNFRASATLLHQAVVAPDFSLTSSAVTPASVSAGQSATATVTVTSIAGFSGSVSLICSVSPSAADAPTCLLTPVTVQSSGGAAATSGLSITSVAPHSLLGPTDPPLSGGSLAVLWLVVSGFLLAGLVLAKGPGRKQLWLNGLFAYTLAGTLAMQVACGGSQNTPTGGTAARSYAINVQGASGATQHRVSVTLNVR